MQNHEATKDKTTSEDDIGRYLQCHNYNWLQTFKS